MNELLSSLSGYGLKQISQNRYVSKCPCHDEKTPSLTITVCDNGKTIAHCFGCGANGIDVVQALGLSTDQLFPDDGDFDRDNHQHKKQIYFQREQFMSDYRLTQLAESWDKNNKPFTKHDLVALKNAIKRINTYKFNAHEAYKKLIKQDAMQAALNCAFYEFEQKTPEEKYGITA